MLSDAESSAMMSSSLELPDRAAVYLDSIGPMITRMTHHLLRHYSLPVDAMLSIQ